MYRIILSLIFCISFLFAGVNINTADKKELMTLDGIGSKKADEIIKYRANNKFNSVEDLKKVNGIGDKLFNKIKDKISVNDSK
ncbi:helix-hairpin-helix domain-containing protein [Helicobacter sp. MIT 99-5507]|uniref:ComEA family DNA-binding protein n=1 Tax=Helicobacter sp. MIT 99-5507 TaxID=152489 RepID=UPI000E1EEF7C|nr:helix-hairpin-helix domain-containing protein [Helicobacter sp. MIT 99-5507]RDU57325.1 DNA-binding protein [Helicobacter sp. MIT 99-5507]